MSRCVRQKTSPSRTRCSAGVSGFGAGGWAITSSMGHIVDRTVEHLGQTDSGIIVGYGVISSPVLGTGLMFLLVDFASGFTSPSMV